MRDRKKRRQKFLLFSQILLVAFAFIVFGALTVSSANDNIIKFFTNNQTRFSMTENGSIGIGTEDPVGAFAVNGTTNLTGYAVYNGSQICTAANGLCVSVSVESDPAWTGNSSTVARTGTCAAGFVVQNTTTSGVQCVVDATAAASSSGGNMTMWRWGADTGSTANVTNFTLARVLSGTGISTSIVGFDVFVENTGDTNAADDFSGAWSALTGKPAGFSDDVDNDTTYSNGSGLSLVGTVFNHTDTSSQASSDNSARTYIQDIVLDTFGHITSIVTAAETVVDTDTNNYTISCSVTGTSTKTVTCSRNGWDNYTYSFNDTDTDTNSLGTLLRVSSPNGSLVVVQNSTDVNITTNITQMDAIFYLDTNPAGYITSFTEVDPFYNRSWNQSKGDALYAPIGTGGNTSWNQTHANTLYAPIATVSDNTSWNVSAYYANATATFYPLTTNPLVYSNITCAGSNSTHANVTNGTNSCIMVARHPGSSESDGNNYTISIDITGTTTKIVNLVRSGIPNINASFTDIDTTYSNGSGLSLVGTVFNHTDTSSQASSDNSARTYIQDIVLDTFGHITSIVTAAETVVDTTYNASYLVNGTEINATILYVGSNGNTTTKARIHHSSNVTSLFVNMPLLELLNTNVSNTQSSSNNNYARLDFTTFNFTGTKFIMASIIGVFENHTNATTGVQGNLVFATVRSGTPTEAMRIDENGRLGIGTTTPSQLLDVSGNMGVDDVLGDFWNITNGNLTTGRVILTVNQSHPTMYDNGTCVFIMSPNNLSKFGVCN